MNKKRRIIISAVSGVLVLALVFLSYNAYLYFHPSFEFRVGRSVDGKKMSPPALIHGKEGIFGISQKVRDHLSEYSKIYPEFYKKFVAAHQFDTLEIQAEVKDGKTVMTHTGTYTDKKGNTKEVKEDLVFDFVLTTKIVNE